MAEGRIKSKHQQPFGSQGFDFGNGGREESHEKSNFFETENECCLVESPVHGSPRAKQLKHHMTRISQNVEPRYFFFSTTHQFAASPLYLSLLMDGDAFLILKDACACFRVSVQAVEPLSSGKQGNKLRNGAIHNGKKESTDTTEPDLRRSRSLPRGKFTLS